MIAVHPLDFLQVSVRHGIRSASHLIILLSAERQPGISMGVLRERCGTSGTAITHAVDLMAARGWLERRPVPGDRRGHGIHLTESGALFLAVLGSLAEHRTVTTP